MFDPSTMTDEQRAMFGYPPLHPPVPAGFAKWEQPYNSLQLASYVAGRALVAAINARPMTFPPDTNPRPMGGGVLAGDDEFADVNAAPQIVGLFVPSFFGLAPRMETGPDGTKYVQLHMRFANGAIIDVGLFLDKLSRYPLAQEYAVSYLAAEVEASAALQAGK